MMSVRPLPPDQEASGQTVVATRSVSGILMALGEANYRRI